MSFDLQSILESKLTLRQSLASRPVAEKLVWCFLNTFTQGIIEFHWCLLKPYPLQIKNTSFLLSRNIGDTTLAMLDALRDRTIALRIPRQPSEGLIMPRNPKWVCYTLMM